jgi:hypothetical protein
MEENLSSATGTHAHVSDQNVMSTQFDKMNKTLEALANNMQAMNSNFQTFCQSQSYIYGEDYDENEHYDQEEELLVPGHVTDSQKKAHDISDKDDLLLHPQSGNKRSSTEGDSEAPKAKSIKQAFMYHLTQVSGSQDLR